MRITLPTMSMSSSHAHQALALKHARQASLDGDHLRRTQEHVNARALISAAELSFDIDLGGNSITVTLTDRASGEAFRKLVYDRAGLPSASRQSGTGRVVDITV